MSHLYIGGNLRPGLQGHCQMRKYKDDLKSQALSTLILNDQKKGKGSTKENEEKEKKKNQEMKKMDWCTVLKASNRLNNRRTTLDFEKYRSLAASEKATYFHEQRGQKWRLKWVKNVREVWKQRKYNEFREVSKGKEQKQLEKEVGSRGPFFCGCDEHI